MLLQEQANFSTVPLANIKTSSMMIGEFDYNTVFFDNVITDEFGGTLLFLKNQ